jgi:ABC-type glycerol-3-phosphate transport system substrate-binding protein
VDVAPSVVPDVALFNQHDLIAAAEAGLLQRLDDTLLTDVGYFPAALSAVTTTQGIWAFPYVAQAQQMAHTTEITETVPLSWTAVLSGSYQMLFPAGPPEGLATDTLLAMYLGAGGRTTDQAGQATLDRVTLERLYGFFAEMWDTGLLDVDTALTLTDASTSWARYQEGLGDLTPVSVATYWAPREPTDPEAEDPEAEPAYRESVPSWVPTPDGTPITILHTWGLAILTDDPVRSEAALGLVNWLVSEQQMGDLTRAAELVPTHRQAVRAWSLQPGEQSFVESLLSHGVRPCSPAIDTTVRRALQAGLTALLLQEVASPEQAATLALTSLRR